jgi:hypothetical protein
MGNRCEKITEYYESGTTRATYSVYNGTMVNYTELK